MKTNGQLGRTIVIVVGVLGLAVGTSGASCGSGGDEPERISPPDSGSNTGGLNDAAGATTDAGTNSSTDTGTTGGSGDTGNGSSSRDTAGGSGGDTADGTSNRDTGRHVTRDTGRGGNRDTGTPSRDTSGGDGGTTINCNSDGNEPNDTPGSATSIMRLYMRGAVCANDPDWFELPYHLYDKGHVVQAALTSSHNNPKIDFELFRKTASGSVVKVASSSPEAVQWGWTFFDIFHRVPKKRYDPYLLRIRTTNSSGNIDYSAHEVRNKSFCANDSHEPNDSKRAAAHLSYNSGNTRRKTARLKRASACGSDTVDWYSVDASAGDKVRVNVNHPGADDIEVSLHHPNAASSHQIRRIPMYGDAGTYTIPRGSGSKLYIRVERPGYIEDASDYTMRVMN